MPGPIIALPGRPFGTPEKPPGKTIRQQFPEVFYPMVQTPAMAHPIPVKGAEAMEMIRMGEAPVGTQVSMPITPAPGPLGYEEGRMFTTGAEPTAPSALTTAPQAPVDESGGWIQFGPGTEKIPLPRGEPQVAPDRNQILQQVRANPISFISRLEVKMGQQGLPEGTRMGYRHALARLMGEAGVDPGAALLYAQGGAQALPQVASLLSRQAQAQAEEAGRIRRMMLATEVGGGLSARRTEASMKRGIAQAKQQGKKVAIIIEPDGSQTPIVLDKPTKFLEFLYTKRGVLERMKKGEIPEDQIAIIDMRPTRTRQTPSMSFGPEGVTQTFAPPMPNPLSESEYSGVLNELQRRRGR